MQQKKHSEKSPNLHRSTVFHTVVNMWLKSRVVNLEDKVNSVHYKVIVLFKCCASSQGLPKQADGLNHILASH